MRQDVAHLAAGEAPDDPVEDLLLHCQTLVDTALTSGDQATWVGVTDDGRSHALDATTYDGLAGPLLMLAHAVALAPEPRTARLLTMVATSMLARQHELPVHGFHTGQAGTAALLAEAATISAVDQVREIASQSLLQVLRSHRLPADNWDLLAGLAGSVVGLTAAGDLLGWDVDQAVGMLGRRLAAQGETDAAGGLVRWQFRSRRRSVALAGLAHGGTGAALALALASRRQPSLNDLVGRTIRFEDEQRTDSRGWLDYRAAPLLEPATAWCHGSAGIGVGSVLLDRVLRPGHSVGEPDADAMTARIRTALDRTRVGLGAGADDGLCHGLSGQVLCCLTMAMHIDAGYDSRRLEDLLRTARRPPASDLRLGKGRPGGLLARLALAGRADPPLFVALLPARRPSRQAG